MFDVICLEKSHEDVISNQLRDSFSCKAVYTPTEMVISLIEQTGTKCVVLADQNNIEIMSRVIEMLKYFNNILPVVLVGEVNKDILNEYKNINNHIYNFKSVKEVIDNFNSIKPDHNRAHNRVDWPLTAKFGNNIKDETLSLGKVTSLSISGAFIQTDNLENLTENKDIYLEIKFKEFKFSVDGSIIRTQKSSSTTGPKGFAVKFHDISTPTTRYIESIIKDKLVNTILGKFSFEM